MQKQGHKPISTHTHEHTYTNIHRHEYLHIGKSALMYNF